MSKYDLLKALLLTVNKNDQKKNGGQQGNNESRSTEQSSYGLIQTATCADCMGLH